MINSIFRSGISFFLLCAAVLFPALANADEPTSNAEAPGSVVHQILPSDTDSRINTFTGEGFVHWSWYNPNAEHKPQLVVFFPGTGGKGSGSVPFNTAAANLGFHVLSLAYPDTVSMSMFHASDDENAFAKARTNIITGKVQFGNLNVDEPNSIENRLVAALRFLSRAYPSEHWAQFLDHSNNVLWDKVILAGQSQGGGHACFMALKLHKVARVLMFGAPKDFNVYYNKPAAWYSDPSVTPLNRFFSFVHQMDGHNGCTYPQQLLNYRALTLMPEYSVIDVDQIPPPYQHSRLLTSSFMQRGAHAAPVHDVRYSNAWQYLLTEPVR